MSLLKVQADGPHARSVTGNKATFSDRGLSECELSGLEYLRLIEDRLVLPRDLQRNLEPSDNFPTLPGQYASNSMGDRAGRKLGPTGSRQYGKVWALCAHPAFSGQCALSLCGLWAAAGDEEGDLEVQRLRGLYPELRTRQGQIGGAEAV